MAFLHQFDNYKRVSVSQDSTLSYKIVKLLKNKHQLLYISGYQTSPKHKNKPGKINTFNKQFKIFTALKLSTASGF